MMYRGFVSRVTASGVYAFIPQLGGTSGEFGPMELYSTNGTGSVATGDKILVGQVGDIKEDLVVIGTLELP